MKREVQAIEPPPHALILAVKAGGAFTDGFACDVDGAVSLPVFVAAFYATPLFKLERFILRWLARRPSTDDDVQRLARGDAASFAAWTVEARAPDQLLLADLSGRTKSWLMVEPLPAGEGRAGTRLYFGSAVVPRQRANGEAGGLGWGFEALLGVHEWYSRRLLAAARRRLLRVGDDLAIQEGPRDR